MVYHFWHEQPLEQMVLAEIHQKKNFWTINQPSKPSWGIRSIFRSRDLAKPHICYLVGNEADIDFWNQPWHPRGVLSSLIPRHNTVSSLSSLTSLDQIHLDGPWNPTLNIGSLAREKAILSEVLFNDTASNLPIWKPNSNGLFTAKSGWEVTRQKFVKPGWASRIWFSCHIPRHALVSWKALKNGLSTTDNLPFLDPSVNRSCILCNFGLESVTHLFFQCNYSKWIWNIILGKLGHRRNPNPDLLQEELWLANNFKGAGQTSKLAYIAFEAAIYIIWIERNNRVFHKISLPNSTLLSEILILVRSKVLGMKIEEEDNPSNRAIASNFGCTLSPKFRPPEFCSWLKPVQGTYKINSDASLDAEG
ncbi:uncharacterized protein LOC143869884 [Tasmannia lanceolata]|uniref:uncharacterized protein LOC143869884 n=1 Tax=Tasmannia lanceolata TaxID=3420 RepID=UPI004063D252